MTIKINASGEVLVGPGGFVIGGYDASAINDFDYQPVCKQVFAEDEDGNVNPDDVGVIQLTLGAVPGSPHRLQVTFFNDPVDEPIAYTYYIEEPAVGVVELGPADVVLGSLLNLSKWYYVLEPITGVSPVHVGRSKNVYSKYTDVSPPPPPFIPFTLTTPPSLVGPAQTSLTVPQFTEGVYAGEMTSIPSRTFWISDAAPLGANKTQLTLSSGKWPSNTLTGKKYSMIETARGYIAEDEIGEIVTETAYIDATPLVVAQPAPPAVVMRDSFFDPANQTTWYRAELNITNAATVGYDELQWTTSFQTTAQAIEELDQWEPLVKVGNYWQTFMREGRNTDPNNTPRLNYGLFRESEGRRSNFRVRGRKGTQWSEMTAKFTVPNKGVVPPTDDNPSWVPLIARAKAAFDQGYVDGPGMQFWRDMATSPDKPDRILATMDCNMPFASDDFGVTIYSPQWRGMFVGYTGLSALLDPDDGDIQLIQYSAGAQQKASSAYDAFAGVYRSTDGGKTCELVLPMPGLIGCDAARKRHRTLAQDPRAGLTGKSNANRRIYAVHNVATVNTDKSKGAVYPTCVRIDVWRSDQGGKKNTWTKVSSPSVATFGDEEHGILGLYVAPNGDVYARCKKGLFRSTDGAESWSKLGSLPAGEVMSVDVRAGGGEVWAGVKNQGLFKSTNNGSTWTKNAALGTYNVQDFAISPVNRQRIVICGSGTAPRYSHNGGASWSSVTTNPRPGQEATFPSAIGKDPSFFLWSEANDNQVYVMRFQHLGASTDGGKTFNHAGLEYDGVHGRGLSWHPTNASKWAMTCQDHACIATPSAGDYITQDPIGGPHDGPGKEITDAIGGSVHVAGGGVIWTKNNLVVSAQGNHSGSKVIVVEYGTEADPLKNIRIITSSTFTGWGHYGFIDPGDDSYGYIGASRIEKLDSTLPTDIKCVDIKKQVMGVAKAADGTVRVFAIDKSKTSKDIFVSTNRGTTWTKWHTMGVSFRVIDQGGIMTVAPTDAATLFVSCVDGKVYKVQGVSNPTVTPIFNMANFVPALMPQKEIGFIACDSRNLDILYVSSAWHGVGPVWRTQDGGDNWTEIAKGAPLVPLNIAVNPHNGDLIGMSSHGTWCYPAPPGYRTQYGITVQSTHARAKAFLDAHL